MRKIKKVIAWFGKRPTIRVLIVAYAILSMILALAGAWSSSLLSLSCFLAFLLNDSHILTIERQDKTIQALFSDMSELREELKGERLKAEYFFYSLQLTKLKVSFCKRQVSCSYFLDRLQYFEACVSESSKELKEYLDKLSAKQAKGK